MVLNVTKEVKFFSFQSYLLKVISLSILVPHHTMVRGTLVIVQIFDFRFLKDLHVLGSGEFKKPKISMVSGCSLASMLVC